MAVQKSRKLPCFVTVHLQELKGMQTSKLASYRFMKGVPIFDEKHMERYLAFR